MVAWIIYSVLFLYPQHYLLLPSPSPPPPPSAAMVDDNTTVCCMCGDLGFSDKLFRCLRCSSRYQHTYCGSYYQEISKPSGICDWCRSSDQPTGGDATKSTFHYSKTTTATTNKSGHGFRSTYFSGEKIKQQRKTTLVMSSRNGGATSSLSPSRPSPTSKSSNGRRYKLLKDVLY
ncbi:hypothetical protein ZOSMA_85G00380 [Zostera marina]|uniref:PHD-type zinc finger plants domain-containing protein n=1 Tax=Zostera marina TaxID=29655 RepID=A0A0K9NL27_ZOSMR|nr:hypothetical protein ZOSMA_85G00380 [Zostera marina]